ncbi:UNVERIFIED_CONTAM: hypothetical protein FKN15_067542 [Acipenser sinensis]
MEKREGRSQSRLTAAHQQWRRERGGQSTDSQLHTSNGDERGAVRAQTHSCTPAMEKREGRSEHRLTAAPSNGEERGAVRAETHSCTPAMEKREGRSEHRLTAAHQQWRQEKGSQSTDSQLHTSNGEERGAVRAQTHSCTPAMEKREGRLEQTHS